MNTCEDCGLKHQAFSLDCPHCSTELTAYSETGSLTYDVSIEKGQLVMRITGVEPYDDFDGHFYCSGCASWIEVHELTETLDKVTVQWVGAKKIIPNSLT